jgi:NitT/TauT family transport system ATP-binding protein
MPGAFVEVAHVDLAYDDVSGNAIEDVTLSMQEHEFIAVVGPSGCGKSTFMKLCSGLRRASKGSVSVGGREVGAPLKIVGMAFQNATLLPWRTALDNVLLPLEIVEPYRSSFKARRAEYAQKATELLRSVGLEGYEHRFPWELSGGMQQRVSICRALVHEPKLLLLDEPFAALDAFTREELWGILRDLWMRHRFTVVLVTHDLREATFLADTVYVMSKRPGRILAQRTVDLPRPRELDIIYSDHFADIVRELREHIGRIRSA